jgi:cystathionine beta-lyase
MPTFDFEHHPNRSDSDSIKWKMYPADVLPMWVADMDFTSPPAVQEALQARLDHGVFGYAVPPQTLLPTIQARLARSGMGGKWTSITSSR